MSHEATLKEIVRNEKWLIDLLEIARACGLPNWYIAAGAIRNTVWDVLHNYDHRTPLADVDLVYFDESTLDYNVDVNIWQILKLEAPYVTWNVVNQARGHLMNGWTPQVYSTEESIAYWSEIPTCTGIRLNQDDSLTVCAPHGLDDLMNLRVRPVPEPFQNAELYKERVEKKKWKEKWPKLNIAEL